jgi:peptide/nickel transport system permease protein
MRFLLRRGLASLLQLLVLSAAIFVLFRLLPGDLYSSDLGNGELSKASIEARREAQGLNRPWTARYSNWLTSSLHGDFGASLAYGIPVSQLLAPRISKTIAVAVPALALAWLVGLGAAALAIKVRMAPGWLEPGAAAAAMIPDVAAVSILLWLAVWAGISVTAYWLPLACLTFTLLPIVFLHASGELRHARELEFVRIAESRGVSGLRLWLRYALPAAANPFVSLAALLVSAAIGSSFIVEVLTGWPGVGPLFLEAVQARDYPIVQAVLIGLGALLIVANLAADLILYKLDPRIRDAA